MQGHISVWFSSIDWISEKVSQKYTDMQSLVKCLDHRVIVSDTACSQACSVYVRFLQESTCYLEMQTSRVRVHIVSVHIHAMALDDTANIWRWILSGHTGWLMGPAAAIVYAVQCGKVN